MFIGKEKALIELNYRDSKPIYEQIEDSYKKLIINGALKVDEKLPSVRSLATKLSINPNTIQRAYNELEAAGYLYSVPGKGSYVALKPKANRERIEGLKAHIRELIEELRFYNISDEEIFEMVREGL